MVSRYVDLKNLSIGLFEGGRRRQVKMIIIKKTREREKIKRPHEHNNFLCMFSVKKNLLALNHSFEIIKRVRVNGSQ